MGPDNQADAPPTFEPAREIAAFEKARDHYRATTKHLDALAYELCRDPDSHDDEKRLYVKTALIARGYKTNIEPMIAAVPDGHGGLDRLVEWLATNAAMIREAISAIGAERHELDLDAVNRLLPVHGTLSACLATIVRRPAAGVGASAVQASPRSFVSKYLHCHAPVVPLYDRWVDRPCRAFVPHPPRRSDVAAGPSVDSVYRAFVIRFWTLYQQLAATRAATGVTVRELDYYLVTRGRYRG